MRHFWTETELDIVRRGVRAGDENGQIARALGRSLASVESKVTDLRATEGLGRRISQPLTKIWDDYLRVQGDALILGDVETPYHHADFVNRCIELASKWRINQIILNGDFVHFANFSQWGESFQPDDGELDDPELNEKLNKVPEQERNELRKLLAERFQVRLSDNTLSDELRSVRHTASEIGSAFETVYLVLGNHEYRKIRITERGEPVSELLRFLHAGTNWKAAPYYYCVLETDNPVPYRIEHPGAAGEKTAIDLAIQYHTHIVMAHSHRWAVQRDPSGDYWAIQSGHCVDEKRLSYVQIRSKKRNAHALGAVIVRGGYPYVLCESTQWVAMGRM